MKYDIGIGTTNRCNFNCAHCYSRSDQLADLSLDDIKKLADSIDIGSVNFGTGENILNKDFIKIMEYLASRKIKMSLTSNGYSIMNMEDEQIKLLNDVDISIDFYSSVKNDIFRNEESSRISVKAVEKLKKLSVETSIVTCLSRRNFDEILHILEIARHHQTNLRINVYKPVNNKELTLSYDQFWTSIQNIFDHTDVVSCSETVVNTLIGVKILDGGCPCGKNSFRVTPHKMIKPCVYWDKSNISIDDLNKKGEDILKTDSEFLKIRMVPDFCKDCDQLEICKGGCAARRLYSDDYMLPDMYCYKFKKKEPPKLNYRKGNSKDLVHSNYLCTLIIE